MKPEKQSRLLLGVTRSKAKMYEYNIGEEFHIKIVQDPIKLFTVTIGMLGDFAAAINRNNFDTALYSELKHNLRFSAYFFDAYFRSKLNEELDSYLILLSSSAYYLCDLPGSSSVLIRHIPVEHFDLDGAGLEYLLLSLLKFNPEEGMQIENGPFDKAIIEIWNRVNGYFSNGEGEENILNLADSLRKTTYEIGTPRQLLLGDIAAAIIRRKIQNSTWLAMPSYSGISKEIWRPILSKNSFIKELWPAQHLLGQAGIFKGRSAIVQMPTSAGKTKSTELILRSGFLANRVTLAAIIAPFKALCHEIKNSLI